MGRIKNVNLIVILAIVVVGFMSVGYAYVNSDKLDVNLAIQKNWDVGFNTEEYTSFGNAIEESLPVITKNKIKFSNSFTGKNEYKTYTFEFSNKGSIDAKLKEVKLISDQKSDSKVSFNYVLYKGNEIITSNSLPMINEENNDLFNKYGVNKLEVTIIYNGDEVLLDTPVTANYELQLIYTQK